MLSLAQRIRQAGIKSRAVIDTEFIPRNEWDRTARHYKVTLTMPDLGWPGGKRKMTVSYHMGSALKKPPTALEVMSSLLLDAGTVAYGQKFPEWADDFGYDSDSIKARDLYDACREQTEELRNFLLTDRDPWITWLEQTENDY